MQIQFTVITVAVLLITIVILGVEITCLYNRFASLNDALVRMNQRDKIDLA